MQLNLVLASGENTTVVTDASWVSLSLLLTEKVLLRLDQSIRLYPDTGSMNMR
jgi:hypothetical protein